MCRMRLLLVFSIWMYCFLKVTFMDDRTLIVVSATSVYRRKPVILSTVLSMNVLWRFIFVNIRSIIQIKKSNYCVTYCLLRLKFVVG